MWSNKANLWGLPRWLNGKVSACQCRTWVWSLGWEDPLEEEMATLSSILAWRILWTEEPGRPQSMGSQSQTQLNDWALEYLLWLYLMAAPTSMWEELLYQVLCYQAQGMQLGSRQSHYSHNSPGGVVRTITISKYTYYVRCDFMCYREREQGRR